MMSSFFDWLFGEIIIHRNIFPLWYVATGVVLVISIILSIVLHLKRFGFWVLVSAASMSATWEVILFIFGLRAYDQPLTQFIGPIPELIYHSFSETGATILIGLLIIYKLKIINLDKFRDENWMHRMDQENRNESQGD